jgi:hypothetical protein
MHKSRISENSLAGDASLKEIFSGTNARDFAGTGSILRTSQYAFLCPPVNFRQSL